ncbi:hypothetical protein CPB83DRAFT_904396 [Crepidotus variabilis]|uniref:Uncharacterized protein n=1 Tax=Crepidotus variabilis TaxID=179855 RepID=A0A9P6JSX8_9AGAR|nr:hypothetical protein CPB83DRAFT_904396 [Crepidotus variabilis]
MSHQVPNGLSNKLPPVLPDELWGCIGEFLFKADLAKCYSISPILFDLWMKAAFTEVKICRVKHVETLRVLCTMTPLAARYVSKLTLCPQFFLLGETTSSFDRFITQSQVKSLSEKLRGPRSTERILKTVAVQVLLSKITQMTNLKTVVVECKSPDDTKLFGNIALFLDAVKIHANQLENIEINVHMKCLEETLAAIPYCATLRSLSINFEGRVAALRGEDLWRQTARVINLHSATLRRVSILAAEVLCGTIPIFSSLERLPNLAEANFFLLADYFTPQLKESALLQAFLKAHSTQLQALELHSDKPSFHTEFTLPPVFHHPLFNINFPRLKRLGLILNEQNDNPAEFSSQPPIAILLSKYLLQYRGKLQHLAIVHRRLNFSEVQAVSSALGGNGSALVSLSVATQSLDANLLAVLARSFRNLERLGLGSPYLCSTVPTPEVLLPEKCQMFVDSISSCDPALGRWRLRHLQVRIYEHRYWSEIQDALLAALPNLDTLNFWPVPHRVGTNGPGAIVVSAGAAAAFTPVIS